MQDEKGPEPMEEFDVIVCGAGSAGSTAAGLLAADEDLRVLVLEAGPDDEDERVAAPDRWAENLGGERDWGFLTAPEAGLVLAVVRRNMTWTPPKASSQMRPSPTDR